MTLLLLSLLPHSIEAPAGKKEKRKVIDRLVAEPPPKKSKETEEKTEKKVDPIGLKVVLVVWAAQWRVCGYSGRKMEGRGKRV